MAAEGSPKPAPSETAVKVAADGCPKSAPHEAVAKVAAEGCPKSAPHETVAKLAAESSPKSASHETVVKVTLASARDLKNTRLFRGKMMPHAVLTAPGVEKPVVSAAPTDGGTSPVWNQTFNFSIPNTALETSTYDKAPKAPSKPIVLKVDLYDSAELNKHLGTVTAALNKPLAYYGKPYAATWRVIRKGDFRGTLTLFITCDQPSFAPSRGAPEYDQYVKHLVPPPRPRPAPGQTAYGYPRGYGAYGGYPGAVIVAPGYGYGCGYGYGYGCGYGGLGYGGLGYGLAGGLAGGLLLGAALGGF